MNKLFPALLVTLLMFSGCQNTATDTNASAAGQTDSAEKKPSPKVYSSFTEESLYELLTGELAGQRGYYDVALANYMKQAQTTQDAGVAKRAFVIADYAGASLPALRSAQIWVNNAPNSANAQRAVAVELSKSGKVEETLPHLEKLLATSKRDDYDFFGLTAMQLSPELVESLLQCMSRLQQLHPHNDQVTFSKALLLQAHGSDEEAFTLLQTQLVNPLAPPPALLQATLLRSQGKATQGLALLKDSLHRNQDNKALHLSYARMLLEEGETEQAKREFTRLAKRYPDDDNLLFSLALICLEAKAWNEAIPYLQQVTDKENHRNSAYYNLGIAYEEVGRANDALSAYAQVEPSNDYLPAQLRMAEILFSRKQTREARQRLANARINQPDYAVQLYLIEIESLSRHNLSDQAWETVNQALKDYSDDLRLLYGRAMLAEERDDLQQTIKDLRYIIDQEPDNASALNALGYTLTDRLGRHQEALALIQRAYELNPGDPATLDSLGWVYYHLGDLEKAEDLLRKAYTSYPDPELAAHLGEVLWQRGKQTEARQLWQQVLRTDPGNDILRKTILRLTGSEAP